MVARSKRKFDWRFLFLLPLPILWFAASQAGYLDFLKNRAVDWRFRYRGERDAPLKVVYVDIDSKSIAELGNVPWDRAYFAEVCSALVHAGGVKGIGVDVVFSESGFPELLARQFAPGNLEFARWLHSGPPVVLAASYSASSFRDINGTLSRREIPILSKGVPPLEEIEPPELPEFLLPNKTVWTPPRAGLIDTLDGGTRWVPLHTPAFERSFYHMALQMALLHWGVQADAIFPIKEGLEIRDAAGTRLASIPLKDGQLLEVNWFSRWISPERNPRVGFSDVLVYSRMLRAEAEEEKKTGQSFFEQFRDALVFIGPVDPLLQDLAVTPLDETPVPKVGVHGNLVKTMVSGTYLRRVPGWAEFGIVLLLTVAVAGLATAGGSHGLKMKVGSGLVLVGYIVLSFELFRHFHWVLPLAVPTASAFTTGSVAVAWQLLREEKQKGRIKSLFGSYVSPQLVNRMVESGEDPQLGGVVANITAYFSDIQSFSSFSEKLAPPALVELMNEYLTACTEILTEEGGTLDKYIGDAVVAMFGAPVELRDHALRACVASQRVQLRQADLRAKWTRDASKWPEIVWQMQTRIGLNTGPATIGNMGSRTRFNYTMMGDNVNLGARMESGAKAYGVYSLVTEATRTEAERTGNDCVFRFLDRIVVMGRSQPVPIHEIVGLRESVPQTTFECLGVFEQAMARYLNQDWDGALALFQRSAKLEPYDPERVAGVKTNPSLVYLERCREMKLHPPGPDWEGVFIMRSK